LNETHRRFDGEVLRSIFGMLYVIVSLLVNPVDLGYPASRPRKFTIMLHRARCIIPHALSVGLYSSMFFRRATTTGHVFFCASDEVVQEYYERRAKMLYLQPGQLPLSARDVLGQGTLNRLLAYERANAKEGRGGSWIL